MPLRGWATLQLLWLLPAFLDASNPEVSSEEAACPAGAACAEAEVERAEEMEMANLRMELLQQRNEMRTPKTSVDVTGETPMAPAEENTMAQPPTEVGGELTEVPDEELSMEGPYDEVPNETEAEHPRPALEAWKNNETDSELGASWWGGQSSFCQSHHVGFFCQGTTRTRCCKRGRYYSQCGSTIHSTSCGWHGGGGGGYPGYPSYHPGYPGGSHPGWHAWMPPGGYNTWCEHHHTGSFCSHHTRISCCKQGYHYVSCTTNTRSHSYC